jgi:hypothetical protein
VSRSLSSPLVTYLAARAFLPVDLYEIVIGGTTYRYTTHVANLTGVAPATVATYSTGFLQAQGQRQAAGLVADDLEVTVLGSGTETVGGKTWTARALDGDLDNCTFRRFEGYVDPGAGTLVGCVLVFVGDVAEVEPASTSLRMVVSVPSKRFDSSFPSLLIQSECVLDLGSTACGWAGTMEHSATLTAGSTGELLHVATVPGGLDGGYRFFQGAAMAGGYRRSITNTATPSDVTFTVSPPFPAGVIEGLIGSAGALTVRRGCAKKASICHGWYSNLAHFLGAPRAVATSGAS